MFIYKIIFPNGKHYIGKTECSLAKRHQQHKIKARNNNPCILYHAIRKYEMIDTFQLELIDDTAKTSEELNELEKKYIQEYNSYNSN
jgi:hypothetical protein